MHAPLKSLAALTATLGLALTLMAAPSPVRAQEKKDDAKKTEVKKDEPKKDEPKNVKELPANPLPNLPVPLPAVKPKG